MVGGSLWGGSGGGCSWMLVCDVLFCFVLFLFVCFFMDLVGWLLMCRFLQNKRMERDTRTLTRSTSARLRLWCLDATMMIYRLWSLELRLLWLLHLWQRHL